ncbi:hypothetical protein RclHR1_00570010 [Rhizophagus clarus]|uniref:DUF914-domain-containing protein n=1 Tax=Rhizophagus clarus TaxID=94130 RepID=A0A2Z6RPJ4_9GLOM|nr:hypothetical protein RclHR1_00570010 [Rhizophagus clarus]GET04224.1 DUF914-domain-containing protein [Rhizophagus clarus]
MSKEPGVQLDINEPNTENITTTTPNSTNNGCCPLAKNKYFSYLFSKDFILILLLGQFLSFCITCTIVTSGKLAEYNVIVPTTQSLLTYVGLFIIYTPINIYKKGFRGYFDMIKTRWWKYLILSIIDVEGNYFSVKAYAYTSLLSIMLLDAWSTPCVVILLIIFLKVKFHWSQYLAVLICLGGIAVIIASDFIGGMDMHSATKPVVGDIFCLLSATFYAISNVTEEYFVRQRPLYEVIGQMGFYGTIISGIQLAALERNELANIEWTGSAVGVLIAYTIVMICFYTGAPILFRLSSAAFFNLSLLTSDFYSLIFTVYLFHEKVYRLYPIAYVGTLVGLIIYNIYPATKPRVQENKDNNNDEHNKEVKGEKDVEANEIVQ